MRNTKFFPILPDGDGREADIPTTLKGWWNGHRFPSGNKGILRMIFADAVKPDSDGSVGAPVAPIGDHHQSLAGKLLRPLKQRLFSKHFRMNPADPIAPKTAPPTPEDTCGASRNARPQRRKPLTCFIPCAEH